MIRTPVPAIASALALSRSPRGGRPAAGERLPEGLLLLIRILAGDEQALAEARDETGEGTQVLREAANFYVQQVLFAKDASSYRVLGVDADASDERIREHYRWLARWLHPDRNPDAWEVVFSERVSQAWQNMRTADRRARYDRMLEGNELAGNVEPRAEVMRPPPRAPMYEPPVPAGPSLRWLPKAIFAGLGVMALGGIAIISIIQLGGKTQAEAAAAPAPAPAPTEISLSAPAAPAAATPAPAPEALAQSVSSPPLPPVPVAETPLANVQPTAPAPAAPAPAMGPSAAKSGAPNALAAAAAVAAPKPVAAAPAPKPIASAPTSKPIAAAPSLPAPAAPAAASRRAERAKAAALAAAARSAAAPSAPVEAVAVSEVTATPPPSASAPDADGAGLTIGQRDANRLINHFSRAYEDGDLEGMRGLFTADIQGPQGGLKEILRGYEQLFGSSSERKLSVRDVNYFSTGETLTIVASYSAVVTSAHKGRPRHTTGNLRLDLRKEHESWRVFRLRHDEREG